MGDSESAASKKRVAGRQISKDNPELDDDDPEQEMENFKRASDDVLATRRIVKVRHSQPAAATSNPFAALHMVPPSEPVANATNPSAQPDTPGDKMEMKDGADEKQGKSGEGTGTESGTSVDGPNGIEDSNKKVEEKTDISSAKDDDNVEGDAVEEATQLVEAEKDVENGEVNNVKAKEETCKGDKEETEKKPSVEETETENTHEEKTEKEKLENDNKDVDAAKPVVSLSSFQQLSSSQNAFTGFAGTGFGTSSFSFGSIAKEGSNFGASSESVFGFKRDNPSCPFGVGASSNNGSFSLQPSVTSAADVTKSRLPSMQEVPVETGEENEKAVFTADAILYEYSDGGWKERGKGELKLNVSLSDAEKARVIMRARGNYRLILNAGLYPDMALTNMDKKGITFACINSAGEGKNGLSTFALKFKDSSFVEEFRGVVAAHKGKKTTVLKTPENSPKASDD